MAGVLHSGCAYMERNLVETYLRTLLEVKMMLLGSGAHGKIALHPNGRDVIKIMPNSFRAHRELELTRKLQCVPGVIRLLDAYEDDGNNTVCMVLERCELIDVHDVEVKPFIRDAVSVLKDVHDCGIIHGDIKPFNLMKRASDGTTVLIDFGCSLESNEPVPPLSQMTPLYCSPEAMTSNSCTKSDMWAIGVMTYFLLTRKFPFDGFGMYAILRSILTAALDDSVIKDDVARDFINKTLCRNVEKRMDAREALLHPFLESI